MSSKKHEHQPLPYNPETTPELVMGAFAVRIAEAGVKLEKSHDKKLKRLRARLQRSALEKRKLEKAALSDPLTGLPNRRAFDDNFKRIQSHLHRNKSNGSMIIVDIDHFKQVNDKKGHAKGDEILISVADILASHIRPDDAIARFGGEEFTIALQDTKEAGAAALAERLRVAVSEGTIATGAPVTASFGVTEFDGLTAQGLATEQADRALYVAKETGRNQVIRHSKLS